jgi:hypothetical protein
MEAELSDATAVAHRPNQPVVAMRWKLSKWVGGTGERGYESRILKLGWHYDIHVSIHFKMIEEI